VGSGPNEMDEIMYYFEASLNSIALMAVSSLSDKSWTVLVKPRVRMVVNTSVYA